MFDLILKGGRAIDPSTGIDLVQDVAIVDGRIAGISSSYPSEDARRVLDVAGKMVVPGLVDLHTHIYPGVVSNGVEVDESCLRRGVTTAVDGGSSGTENVGGFIRWVAGQSQTRVFCFLHLSAIGQSATRRAGELANPAYADPDGAIEVIRSHSDVIVGLKLRASRPALGGAALPVLQTARRVVDATEVPLMIHIGDTVEPLAEILDLLRRGDIVTHWATGKPNGPLDSAGALLPEVRAARERGVLFDSAHGGGSFSFDVAARLLDQGFPPDAISTDLSSRSVQGPVFDLLTTMTKFVSLGMPLPEVVRRTTVEPARAIGRGAELGSLRDGAVADVSVIEWGEAAGPLRDSYGLTRVVKERLVPFVTLRAGRLVWPQEGADGVGQC